MFCRQRYYVHANLNYTAFGVNLFCIYSTVATSTDTSMHFAAEELRNLRIRVEISR